MQLYHIVMQKNHYLWNSPYVWTYTSHQTLVGGSFARQGGLIAPQVAFCRPDIFTMKNAGLTVIHKAVVLNKQMANMYT